MGVARQGESVKIIFAILGLGEESLKIAGAAVAKEFGSVDLCSEAVCWSASSYYAAEMGEDLWRQYLALAELGRGDDLALLKEKSNQLEVKWSEAGRRRINLDPGFVDVDKLVLASTKSASHRLPIGRGIYAESTLRFEYGRFEPWPYTYPDYRQDLAIEFFSRVRRRLKAQRRARRAGRRGGR